MGLARLLLQEANLLMMDEPTNHLDISSCEILSQAIQEFEGTVIFVSHDRDFIDAVCSHVYAMLPDGRGRLFEGKLDDYRRQALKSDFPDVLDPLPVSGNDGGKSGRSKVTHHASSAAEIGSNMSEYEINALKRDAQKHQKRIAKLDAIRRFNRTL